MQQCNTTHNYRLQDNFLINSNKLKIWAGNDNYKSHWIMMKHLNFGNKQNSGKKIKYVAIGR